MDAEQRARELALEHDLHVVMARPRGEVPEALRDALARELALEARGLVDAEGRPVWWAEEVDGASLLVVDALAESLKQAMVELEDAHELGPWFNLDLVTVLDDGSTGSWHHSPMRPEPRPLPTADALAQRLQGYDWS